MTNGFDKLDHPKEPADSGGLSEYAQFYSHNFSTASSPIRMSALPAKAVIRVTCFERLLLTQSGHPHSKSSSRTARQSHEHSRDKQTASRILRHLVSLLQSLPGITNSQTRTPASQLSHGSRNYCLSGCRSNAVKASADSTKALSTSFEYKAWPPSIHSSIP